MRAMRVAALGGYKRETRTRLRERVRGVKKGCLTRNITADTIINTSTLSFLAVE
jgi:hypothetical protein